MCICWLYSYCKYGLMTFLKYHLFQKRSFRQRYHALKTVQGSWDSWTWAPDGSEQSVSMSLCVKSVREEGSPESTCVLCRKGKYVWGRENMYGYVKICMRTWKYVWLRENMYGNVKICMVTWKYVWERENTYGYVKICMGTWKYVWGCDNMYGNVKICMRKSTRLRGSHYTDPTRLL
jgi:hypothetical protein